MRKLTVDDMKEMHYVNSAVAIGIGYTLASNDETAIVLDSENKLFKVHVERNEVEAVTQYYDSLVQAIEDGQYLAE